MRSNILFDLDGTLTDPKEGIIRCLQYALEKGGHPVPQAEDLLWCIGPPLHLSFAKLVPERDEAYAWELVALYRERYKPTGQFENKIYPGILDLLAKLKRSKSLFIATSKAEPFAKSIAEHFGFHSHFKTIRGCALTGERSDKA
ncbi:MAG: HAD hydrolase-like protein [Bdellovibrionota bacterium]